MSEDISTDQVDLGHHLQRGILSKLRQTGPATYQQLKPAGVEGNAYNYHLRNLKKSGLVQLANSVYELTSTGYLVADAFSMQSQRLMLRPHAYTQLLVTSGKQILVYEHSRPPLAGAFSLLSGKLHYGDDFSASIAREARRRLLSEEYTSRPLCFMNVRYVQGGSVVLHRPGTLWYLDYRGPCLTRQTANGASKWVDLNSIAAMPRVLPEVREGLLRLQKKSTAPIDLNCDI